MSMTDRFAGLGRPLGFLELDPIPVPEPSKDIELFVPGKTEKNFLDMMTDIYGSDFAKSLAKGDPFAGLGGNQEPEEGTFRKSMKSVSVYRKDDVVRIKTKHLGTTLAVLTWVAKASPGWSLTATTESGEEVCGIFQESDLSKAA